MNILINSAHLYSMLKSETHDFNFYFNRLSKISLPSTRDHLWLNDMLLYYLSFLSMDASIAFFSFLLYVLCSVTTPQQLLTIPIVYCYLCPPFFKNNRAFYITFAFCFWNTFISKISQKWFQKHSEKYFLIVIVPYISRILLCVTSPLEVTSF